MLASREPRTTGSQPWSTIGAASATVITANSSIVTTAIRTPGPTSLAPRSEPRSNTTPASTTPTVASTAPTAWTGSSDSPRSSTARITVVPPYATTTGLTTLSGPIRKAVK